MKTIIGIGPRVNKKKGLVTGLSMMFELTMSVFQEKGFNTEYIDLNNRFKPNNSEVAKPSLSNFFSYALIFFEIIWSMLTNRNAIIYINPATTKFGFKRDALVLKLSKLFGHKIVFHQFGALFENFYSSQSEEEKKKINRIYNCIDALIVEGVFAKSQYSFITHQDKIYVVNNGLPESNYVIVKEPKTIEKGETFNLFFMNNMIESKGYIDVLKAVDILVNEMKLDVKCTFAGRFLSVQDDKYFKSIEEAKQWFDSFIKENNLSDRVNYFNSVFGEDKSKLFLKSHVFLLPSYYVFEGQPTAILEALAYGCVPVVTKYRLIPEMVNKDNGMFVPPVSPQEIAEAIKSLYINPDKYRKLSEGALIRFNKDFTRDQYAMKIYNIINKVS